MSPETAPPTNAAEQEAPTQAPDPKQAEPEATPASEPTQEAPAEEKTWDEEVDDFFANEAKKAQEPKEPKESEKARDEQGKFKSEQRTEGEEAKETKEGEESEKNKEEQPKSEDAEAEKVPDESETSDAPATITYKVDGEERKAPAFTPENEAWYRERIEKAEAFDTVVSRRSREASAATIQEFARQAAEQGYIVGPDPQDPQNRIVIVPKPGLNATAGEGTPQEPDPYAKDEARFAELKTKANSPETEGGGLTAAEVIEIGEIQERRLARMREEINADKQAREQKTQEQHAEQLRQKFTTDVGGMIVDRAKVHGDAADDVGRAAWAYAVQLAMQHPLEKVKEAVTAYFDRLDGLRAPAPSPQSNGNPTPKPATPAPARAVPPAPGGGSAPSAGTNPLDEKPSEEWTQAEWETYFRSR
ncbi:MAG: hypothetical protein ACE5FA_02320 [Dehalococcoidia bacterium]